MRKGTKRLLPGLALVATLALVLAGCGGGGEPTATQQASPPTTGSPTTSAATPTATRAPAPTPTPLAQPTGQFRLALEGFSLYALLPGLSFARSYLDTMFDVNLGEDANAQLDSKTGFVTAWDGGSDSKVWTLKTRSGVVFHDDSAATANDLKFSLQYYQHPGVNPSASGSTTRAPNVASIEAPDDRTVVVTLKGPDIFFPFKYLTMESTGTSASFLLPKSYMESKGIDLSSPKSLNFETASKSPVGSGPYKFKSDIVNQEVNMEAWERPHWLYGTVRFKTAQVRAIPDPSSRVALLRTAGVEAANIPHSAISSLKADGMDIRAEGNGRARFGWLSLQEQYKESYPGYGKNPLADVRVRQALSLAVDRDLIVQKFLAGVGEPNVASLSPQDLGYKAGAHPVPKQDLAKGKALLTEAGYPNGFTITMYQFITIGYPSGPEMMEAIAVWWESLGLKVNRKTVESSGTYVGVVAKGFSEPTAGGLWVGFRGSITAATPAGIKTGVTRVTEDDEIDQAHKAIAAATSLAAYTQAVQKLADLNVNKWIDVNLFVAGTTYAVRPGLGGATWNLGRGGNGSSVNLNQLLSGKDIVR